MSRRQMLVYGWEPVEERIRDIFALKPGLNDRVKLLARRDVLQWLYEDFSFLPQPQKSRKTAYWLKMKAAEDEWGRAVMKSVRSDLGLQKQWTNLFGEMLCREVHSLRGQSVASGRMIERLHPDLETEDAVIEVKTETYFTTGTAGEKIMGVPYKYAKVPRLFGKPLQICVIGGAEKACREDYDIIDPIQREHLEYVQLWSARKISFVPFTTLLATI